MGKFKNPSGGYFFSVLAQLQVAGSQGWMESLDEGQASTSCMWLLKEPLASCKLHARLLQFCLFPRNGKCKRVNVGQLTNVSFGHFFFSDHASCIVLVHQRNPRALLQEKQLSVLPELDSDPETPNGTVGMPVGTVQGLLSPFSCYKTLNPQSDSLKQK